MNKIVVKHIYNLLFHFHVKPTYLNYLSYTIKKQNKTLSYDYLQTDLRVGFPFRILSSALYSQGFKISSK